MRVDGRLTRTGVLPYHLADGSVIRELRLPEEVFKADSMATLVGAPVTELHGGGFITPRNVREHSVGHVSSTKRDGKFLSGSVQVQDEATIAKVTRRELVELSPGYRCKMDASSGTYEGEPYDVIQRSIEYNHLAMGPKDWGRSGNEVALRLDGRGAGAAIAHIDHNSALGDYIRDQFSLLGRTRDQLASDLGVDEFELSFLMSGFSDTDPAMLAKLASLFQVELSVLQNLTVDEGATFVNKRDAQQQECPTMKCTYNLDGVAYELEVADALAANFKAAMAKRETERQDSADKAERLEGELAASKKTGDDLQTKLDAATDPKRLAEAAAARVQLTLDCKRIAPELELAVSASARDMKVAALTAAEHKLDSKASDGFVDGLFAGALLGAPEAGTERESAGVTPPVVKLDKLDAKDEPGSDAARTRMVKRNADMWKPKSATN